MSRDDRIRDRLFPGATPFEPKKGGYTAIPFIMRRVQWLFEPRAWQVYCYVLMRIGPKGIGWLTMQEMSWDLGFRSMPKLKVYLDKLVDEGWILHKSSRAREYFLAPDQISVLASLVAKGKIPADRLEAIDELLESLKWKTLGVNDDDSDVDDDDDGDDNRKAPSTPSFVEQMGMIRRSGVTAAKRVRARVVDDE